MKKGTIIILISLFFDQLTKQLAFRFLYDTATENSEIINPIPYLLRLSYTTNTGASFNWLDGRLGLFIVITILALGMFFYLFKDIDFKTKKIYSLSIIFFIAGTLGNFIDRLFLGHVIDFMQFPFLKAPLNLLGLDNFYNNFADMYLSLAIVLFAIDLFFFEPKRNKKVEKTDEINENN